MGEYKITSKNLNAYEIQDLLDFVDRHYQDTKNDGLSRKIMVMIQKISEDEQTYPLIREVKIVNRP